MLERLVRALSVVTIAASISGCLGLAHVSVEVPSLELSGELVNETSSLAGGSIYILLPEFYGESDAFLSITTGKLKSDSLYQWQKIDIGQEKIFSAKFDKESRYIGFMVPFSPGKEVMESRTIFIWPTASKTMYRIRVNGNKPTVEETNIEILKDNLPESLRYEAEKKWGGPRERQIAEELEFYKKAKWDSTNDLHVVEVLRNGELDSLTIELQINESS